MTEVELTEMLTKNIPRKKGSLKLGVGDDCSVIRIGKKDILISCDSLVENVHFKRSWGPWKTWGAKAATAALSDIAAMGGKPCYVWIDLSIPKNVSVKNVAQFYQGLHKVFKKFGVVVAGGNMAKSPKYFSAVTMVWGEAPTGKAMLRSNAKPGDRVYVGGMLGRDRGLWTVDRGPQIELGQWLRGHGCRCCIDVSDGLLKDLNHIATASKIKIIIHSNKIPYCGNLREALTRGEDYVLAFTGPWTRDRGPGTKNITEIGEVTRGKPGLQVFDLKGNLLSFPKLGFDHKIGPS